MIASSILVSPALWFFKGQHCQDGFILVNCVQSGLVYCCDYFEINWFCSKCRCFKFWCDQAMRPNSQRRKTRRVITNVMNSQTTGWPVEVEEDIQLAEVRIFSNQLNILFLKNLLFLFIQLVSTTEYLKIYKRLHFFSSCNFSRKIAYYLVTLQEKVKSCCVIELLELELLEMAIQDYISRFLSNPLTCLILLLELNSTDVDFYIFLFNVNMAYVLVTELEEAKFTTILHSQIPERRRTQTTGVTYLFQVLLNPNRLTRLLVL